MLLIDIALKDIRRYYRSGFALGMMFAAPLLITALIYFAFGSRGEDGGSFKLPLTKIIFANLDQPDPAGLAAGRVLVENFQEPELGQLFQVAFASNEALARAAVDEQKADVALIIPANFTQAAATPGARAAVTVYYDPAQAIKLSMVKTFVQDALDGFAGAKIAVQVAAGQMQAGGQELEAQTARRIASQYITWVQAGHSHTGETEHSPVLLRYPNAATEAGNNPGLQILSRVMAGMIVMFVFFAGASSAASILIEEEEGTLARLFTTPTRQGTILGGKLVAVLLILVVQVAILLVASSLLFGIHWGERLATVLVSTGMIASAAGFGIFIISFLKNMKQAGPVMGGLMTITGMLGGLMTPAIPGIPPAFDTINLCVPQGWAMRGWKLVIAGAGPAEVLLPSVVMAALGMAFFLAGLLLFRKRFS